MARSQGFEAKCSDLLGRYHEVFIKHRMGCAPKPAHGTYGTEGVEEWFAVQEEIFHAITRGNGARADPPV